MEGVVKSELQAALWLVEDRRGLQRRTLVDERKEETSILEGNTQQFKTLII